MLKMSLRETKNNKMYITTTSFMPFAEYEICTFNLKMYIRMWGSCILTFRVYSALTDLQCIYSIYNIYCD